jgi:hypothetical protein
VAPYLGHRAIATALEQDLPPVALLSGPPSVGKWTLTRHLAAHHGVQAVDTFRCDGILGIDTVRALIGFVGTQPFGTVKLVCARVDEASDAARGALLKTLEEPPAHARFLLTTAAPELTPLTSRAQVFRFGLLSAEELTTILVGQGLGAGTAARVARAGTGRVREALGLVGYDDAAHATVLTLLRAVVAHDQSAYQRALRAVDDRVRDNLLVWLGESLTGRWRHYVYDDCEGLTDRALLHRVSATLAGTAAITARLAVRAALDPLMF